MKLRNDALLLILAVRATIWWGSQPYTDNEGNLPRLSAERVERGDVPLRVVAHGSILPVQPVTKGSQVSRIVDQVLVDFNGRVRRGHVIAQIDPSTFAAAGSSADAELEAGQAGWPALFSTEAMFAAVSVSAAVGLFFGFYPAWKASRLDPIVALGRG